MELRGHTLCIRKLHGCTSAHPVCMLMSSFCGDQSDNSTGTVDDMVATLFSFPVTHGSSIHSVSITAARFENNRACHLTLAGQMHCSKSVSVLLNTANNTFQEPICFGELSISFSFQSSENRFVLTNHPPDRKFENDTDAADSDPRVWA